MAFTSNIGGSLGPVLIGALAEATSLRVASAFSGCIAAAGVAFWGLVLPETLQAAAPQAQVLKVLPQQPAAGRRRQRALRCAVLPQVAIGQSAVLGGERR